MLFEISFPSNDTGYVITDSGIIRKTVNGATSWSAVPIPPKPVYSLLFITGQFGFACGDSLIYKTTNGGASWTQVENDNEVSFTKMFFPTSSVGYATATKSALGDSCRIYKTINGGNSWTKVSTLWPPCGLPGLFFTNQTNGFWGTTANVFATSNSGSTFNNVYSDNNVDNDIFNIYFPNADTGYVVGYFDLFLKTTDGGASWSATAFPGAACYDIYFFNGRIGFASGGDGFSSGWVQQTSDGTSSWTPSYTSPYTFYCMDFPSDTVGYVGGDNGTVLKFSGVPTGISENKNADAITIFPNPATVFTQINNVTPGSKIILLDLSGQIVKEQTAENDNVKMNLENVSPGIYFVQVVNGEKTSTRKLVVY